MESKKGRKEATLSFRISPIERETLTDAEALRLALCESYYFTRRHITRSRFAREATEGRIPGISCDYHPDHIVRILREYRRNDFDAVVDGRSDRAQKSDAKPNDPFLRKLIRGLKRHLGSETSMPDIRRYIVKRYPRYNKVDLRSFYRAWRSMSALERAVSPEEMAHARRVAAPLISPQRFYFGQVVFGDWMKVRWPGLRVVDDFDGKIITPELLGHLEAHSRACCAIKLCRSQPTAADAIDIARDVLFSRQTGRLGLARCGLAPHRWHTDRGPAYTAYSYMTGFKNARILLTRSDPHKPTDNPFIERFWKTFRRQFRRTTLERLRARWEAMPSKKAESPILTITFSELESLLVQAVRDYNTRLVHSVTKMTPAQAWAKSSQTFRPKHSAKFYDECLRLRETVTLGRYGSFKYNGVRYLCRKALREKNAKAIITWKPESDLSRLRLYLNRRYRGIACPIFRGSKQERWLREAFAVECAKAQNEANAAAAFTVEQILEHDETFGSCLQPLSDEDAELALRERNEKKRTRSAGLARRDGEREAAASRLSIIPATASVPEEQEEATTNPDQSDATAPKAIQKVNIRKDAK